MVGGRCTGRAPAYLKMQACSLGPSQTASQPAAAEQVSSRRPRQSSGPASSLSLGPHTIRCG